MRAEEAWRACEELGDRIHAMLRDGDLDVEPLIELSCLLEEQGRRTPATREVLERPVAHLTAADMDRLGRGLLDDIGFGPTFVLEPGLWTALEQVLKIVERDVRAAGLTGPLELIIHDWDDSGQARVEFRGGCHGDGIWPVEARDPQRALARVADAAQESIMDVAWVAWPTCPEHGLGLHAELEDGTAVWWCAGAGSHIVAPVGELPSKRR